MSGPPRPPPASATAAATTWVRPYSLAPSIISGESNEITIYITLYILLGEDGPRPRQAARAGEARPRRPRRAAPGSSPSVSASYSVLLLYGGLYGGIIESILSDRGKLGVRQDRGKLPWGGAEPPRRASRRAPASLKSTARHAQSSATWATGADERETFIAVCFISSMNVIAKAAKGAHLETCEKPCSPSTPSPNQAPSAPAAVWR